METFLLIMMVIAYIGWGFTFMVWRLADKSTKRNNTKKLIEWGEFLSNQLLLGSHTKTEIAQMLMDHAESLQSSLVEETFTEKWHSTALYQWLKKMFKRDDTKPNH